MNKWYGGTKEEMQRLLDDAEKISGIKYDISSYGDIVQAIHVVQEEMGITGTTAKEASETIQGSAAAMKASWQNLMVGLADENANFDQLLQNFIDSVGKFATNLIPRIKIALSGVVNLIKGLVPKIAEELPSLAKNIIPMALGAVLSVFNALAETLPTLLVTLIQTIVGILPDLIPQLVTGLVNMLVLLMTNFDKIILPIIDALPLIIESLITALFENLPQVVAGLTSVIGSLVTSLPQILASLKNAISTFFVSMWDGIKNIFANLGPWFESKFADAWNRIKAVFSNVKQFFTNVWGKIKNVFTNTAQAIADSISGAVRGAINAVLSTAVKIINGFIGAINVAIDIINAIPGVGISHLSTLSVPALAQGAVLPPNKPFLAVVGDQKHGTNIEAPLETIKQAVAEVVGGNGGKQPAIVNVYISSKRGLRLISQEVIADINETIATTGRVPINI